MNKYKDLAKNTGIFAIANFSSKILVFLLVPLYTRTLTTSDYGFYDLSYSTIQLFLPILTLNISEATMRFLMKKDVDEKSVFSISLVNVAIGSIIFGLGILINDICSISLLTEKYGIYIWIFFIFYALNNLFVQFSKGIDRVQEMAIAGVLGTVSMVLFNAILLIVLQMGLLGFFIANITCYAIPTLYLIFKLKFWNYLSKDYNKELQKQMLSFSLPLILNTLAWWVNNTSDRYVVAVISGINSNGLISVAYKIPQILSTVSMIFIQAWQISAIKEQESDSDDNSFSSKIFLHYNALLSVMAGFLILFDKLIASILFGNDFYQAWQFVPFLVISSLLNAAAGYVGAILSANMAANAMATSAFYGMSVNIILNILLTLLIGPQGITIATVISSYIIYEIRRRAFQTISDRVQIRVLLSWILLIVESIGVIYFNSWWLSLIVICLIFYLFKQTFKTLWIQGKRLLKRVKVDV
ncbi:lipopolysaccharide biosynthesis protein [Streptococcus equinus]|uniref:lipopolysaccharide biosynthesis protein n=1 Tax=Streptococcus equinus TaxID=1335 RepID=UPI00040FA8B5|nr:oligosaccharide flippase family protein [Streptococcus equinus]